jgi:glycosyltransferase involved in cell wall biosynthesis
VCSRIPWDKVKKVVFVAEHIRRMMVADWGIPENKTVVIPNGVDTDKFSIKNKIRDPRDIGYAGFINGKKNPDLLLRIIKANPEFTFHLRAEHQDPFWKAVFDRELKDAKNVVWHPRYDNLADFWNLMSGVLSTSIIESFSYNVAEGMACGCKPYIADWEGARDIWPQEHVFTDMPEFSKDIKDEEREGFRRYVVTRYPLRKSLLAMESALLGDLLKAEEKAA